MSTDDIIAMAREACLGDLATVPEYIGFAIAKLHCKSMACSRAT